MKLIGKHVKKGRLIKEDLAEDTGQIFYLELEDGTQFRVEEEEGMLEISVNSGQLELLPLKEGIVYIGRRN